MARTESWLRERLARGLVIPAHPLALTAGRRLDERRQRALTRYYCDAGAGGVAVGVHTTQFAIRDPSVALLQPVLELAAETVSAHEQQTAHRLVTIAGVCGTDAQARQEAGLARSLGYDAALLSLAALRDRSVDDLVAHCRNIADIIPLIGFYLQPAVGGMPLGYAFWRRFLEIPNVVAIKVAPFNRYATLDVVRAVAASGRAADVALYTGNDDSIVADLVTPFRFGEGEPIRFVGGLLGQWAVWTERACRMLPRAQASRERVDPDLLALGAQLTDANAAIFDVPNAFAGCIAGIHEVLRGQGLLDGTWCLDAHEGLSPGQQEDIERVRRAYPHLTDDGFVAEHRDRWLT